MGIKMSLKILDIENNYSNTQGCIDRDSKKWGEEKQVKNRENRVRWEKGTQEEGITGGRKHEQQEQKVKSHAGGFLSLHTKYDSSAWSNSWCDHPCRRGASHVQPSPGILQRIRFSCSDLGHRSSQETSPQAIRFSLCQVSLQAASPLLHESS